MFSNLTGVFGAIVFSSIIWTVVFVIALISILKRTDIPANTKLLWLIVIFLIAGLGLLIYVLSNFKKAKSLLITGIIALILIAASVWYFIKYDPEHNRRSVENEKGLVVNATDLIKEFTSNEDSANKKYVNKTIELSGIVSNILSDSLGATIFIATGDSVNTISFRLLKSNTAITKGSKVTVKGILTGYILNEVQLNEAVITSSTPAPAASQATPAQTTTIKDSPTVKKPSVDTLKKQVLVAPKIYKSKTASIKFFSHTPAEDIEATNTQIVSSLNAANGQISFAALIKGFRFENELMQEHFNSEKYLNSNQFPKAEFKGSITNLSAVKFNTNGTYNATVSGSLTIHGVTKNITATGTVTVKDAVVNINSVFKIHVQDYQVDGADVAENIEVTINASYQ